MDVKSIKAQLEAKIQQGSPGLQDRATANKPQVVNRLPPKVGAQVGKALVTEKAGKKKPATPDKSKFHGKNGKKLRSSSTSDTNVSGKQAMSALADVLTHSPAPSSRKSMVDVNSTAAKRRSLSSSGSPPPSPRSGRFSSSFSSASPTPELRVESPTGEIIDTLQAAEQSAPLDKSMKARSTGNIATRCQSRPQSHFSDTTSPPHNPLPPKPHLKPKPALGPKPPLRPKPQIQLNTKKKNGDTSGGSSPKLLSDAVIAKISTSPTPPSASVLTSDWESHRTSLKGAEESPPPSPPQTLGQSTTASEVGGCIRNADSGYQEDLVDELVGPQSTPPPPEEKKNEIVWDDAKREKARDKRHHIALELLATEKSYVDRLRVVAEEFRGLIKDLNLKSNKPLVSDQQMHLIFLNIGEIFVLNRQLLDDLQKRMDNWIEVEQIGDVISTIAPFLKLYATYTSGFEEAMKLLTLLMGKEKKLDTAVKDFEKQLGTGLGITHYMLEPVQRIPRYRLLLADYLKNLPPDSKERPDAERALKIISEAADRTNNRIKELENCSEILSIQRSLVECQDTLLLQPGRSFLMKGQLQKLSRKTPTPRMFFLFSDVLLHTEPSGPSSYRFKNLLPLVSMKVELPKVSLIPNTFEVMSTTRSLILCASSEEERAHWMDNLRSAINNEKGKRMSLKRAPSLMSHYEEEGSGFGCHAPIMVPDQSVSMCQLCSKMFTLTFRRHHCRACGRVVCGDCSRFKLYLQYMQKKERACQECYKEWKISSTDENDGPTPDSPAMETRKLDAPAVLIIDSREKESDTVMEGYVMVLEGKKWVRYWYMLMKDLAIYKFKAHEDIRAIETIPLPGYCLQSNKDSCIINLKHPSAKKKFNFTFKSDSVEEFDAWVDTLEKVIRLEIPDPIRRDSQSHLVPTSPNDRYRSQSLCLLDDAVEDEQVELEKSI